MLGITEIVDRLSCCSTRSSQSKSAADSEQKTKAGNVNKVVNINLSPSQNEAVTNPDYIEIIQSGHNPPQHQTVCFSDEAVVNQPQRSSQPRLKKIGNVVEWHKTDTDTPLPETQGKFTLSQQ